MTAPLCTAHVGYTRHCDTPLDARTLPDGTVRYSCPKCARRARGRCRDCPNNVPTRKLRGVRPWFCRACVKKNAKLIDFRKVVSEDVRLARVAQAKERHHERRNDEAYMERRREINRRHYANKQAMLRVIASRATTPAHGRAA